jgi:predicted amidohydrolase
MASGDVEARYTEIWRNDPLLLKDSNQTAYGEELLRNLLVYRLLTSSKPCPVDLHSQASLDRFRERSSTGLPSKPPQDVIDHYLDARKNRTSVSRDDFKILKDLTMVADGALTKARTDNTYWNHETAETDFATWNLVDQFNERLRFAAIGFRVKVSLLVGHGYFEEDLCAHPQFPEDSVSNLLEPRTPSQLGRTALLSKDRLRRWEDAIHDHIQAALTRQSEVIVLPEFALPSAYDPDKKPNDALSERAVDDDECPFTKRLRQLCVDYGDEDHFVVAGTRHEQRYNRGLILSKRKETKGVSALWHYKVASARGLGENIMGPFGAKFPTYETNMRFFTDAVAITVAICYDTYDPTTFLTTVLEATNSRMKNTQKIILVPSFNPAPDFVALLRDLSFLSRCMVIYVNGLHGDAEMFVCGFEISDFSTRIDRATGAPGTNPTAGAASPLDAMLQTIHARQQALVEKIRSEEQAEKEKENAGWVKPASLRGIFQSRDRKRLEVLSRLERRLRQLRSEHALDHVITLENCPACSKGQHGTDDYCRRDVLYYNIDVQLIEELCNFRRDYFHEQAFLAKPLQWDELSAMFATL